jgi:alkylation response protein AidB-like acyl-CoA dehydrogenase
MNFDLGSRRTAARETARRIASGLPGDAGAETVIAAVAAAGLLDADGDLLTAALAVESLACHSPSAGVAFALHVSVLPTPGADDVDALTEAAGRLRAGRVVGAVALSSEETPIVRDGRLTGRASWVAPITPKGQAVVGARVEADDDRPRRHVACLVSLDAPGLTLEPVETAALRGLVSGHLVFANVPFIDAGETHPVMARVRILLAAAGLGMGQRALHEALDAARGYIRNGAGGEQTVQGLLADAATELEAARLLTWKAASGDWPSLAESSAAKLVATEATQRAVARATQVIGGDTFRRGHIVEQLAQDVRALELFAGRTEALREAVARETLPSIG